MARLTILVIRVFSKDDEGCIPAEEMKFVLSQVRILIRSIMKLREVAFC